MIPKLSAMALKKAVHEVEEKLVAAAEHIPVAQAEKLRIYHRSAVPHLGLAVPVQREILRRGYSFHCHPFEQQLAIWDAVWRRARYYEVKSLALYYGAARRKPGELEQLWPVARAWIEAVDCWDSSDELSSIYARILEVESLTDEAYEVLASWNRSTNPWKRRQSIVSLLYYSRSRRSVLPSAKILPLIETLLADEDRFVQKAIGWSLREVLTPYPNDTIAFIRSHVRDLSPTAFSEAKRKLPLELRSEITTSRSLVRLRERPHARKSKIAN
jgi:3-methyladenine DNA glycosylase AlkD